MNRQRFFALFAAALSACSTPAPTPDASQPDASQDGSTDDASSSDVIPADAPSADAADGSPWAACMVPAVRVAQTPATMALAAAPARCNQRAHTWRTDPALGTVLDVGTSTNYARTTLAVATTMISEEARYDVATEVIGYQTQDRGQLVRATTLVAYPRNVRSMQNMDVLLVLHGTAGFRDSCGPSGAADTRLLAAAFASTGFVVIAPDYIALNSFGPDTMQPHPYLVGQPTAIASLDAARAGIRHVAARSGPVCATPRVVTIGGSQGGHAALWVDRLAPYYAQELSLEGVVATVPPADLVGETDRALRAQVEATANVAAFWGSSADWYGLAPRLNEVFNAPFDTSIPAALRSACDPEFPMLTLNGVFTEGARTAATSPSSIATFGDFGCMVRENGLTTTSVPRIAPTSASYGILYVTGERDSLVTTSIERAAFTTLCAAGMRMQYLECAGASHTRATTWSLPEIIAFAKDRFAGRPMAGAVCELQAPSRCRNTPAGM